MLVLLSPVIALLLAAIVVDLIVSRADRGPIFYRETRVSRGRTFGLLKFRTLRTSALVAARGHAGPLEHDADNLTWAGRRFLKPWYLDELPQFVNVLRGQISLVGPRPWPPELVARQVAQGHDYRNRIVAGLTGPAQVTKGSAQRYTDLDLRYVEACESLGGWSLLRYDLRVLRQTFGVMARGEGLRY